MRKILCDRCHKEIEREGDIVSINILIGSSIARSYNDNRVRDRQSVELCYRCAADVSRMLDDGGGENAAAV